MNPIPTTPVESSQFKAIGHDGNDTLQIDFPKSTYQYTGVSAEMFAEFMAAESKGSFFIQTIKRNPDKYPYTRLAEEKQEGAAAA